MTSLSSHLVPSSSWYCRLVLLWLALLMFVFFCFLNGMASIPGWPQTHPIVKEDVEFLILLPHPVNTRITGVCYQIWFMWCWRLNLGFPGCWASGLSIELHSQHWPPSPKFLLNGKINDAFILLVLLLFYTFSPEIRICDQVQSKPRESMSGGV